MSHKPLEFFNLTLSFPHKTCFENVQLSVRHGQRIGVVGRNGAGKSSLLALLSQRMVSINDVHAGFVPQIHSEENLSGAEQFNRALTTAFCEQPNVLILDEPTNHLDRCNRASLMRMLKNFRHTLLIASHDRELLDECVDTIWLIDNARVRVFDGRFSNFLSVLGDEEHALENELSELNKQKSRAHEALMKEQQRAKKSRLMGEKHIEERKWPTIVSKAKARRAEMSTGKRKAELRSERESLLLRLRDLKQPEVVRPKFFFPAGSNRDVVFAVRDGAIGFSKNLIQEINVTLRCGERMAIVGDNGAGKSTFIKALLHHPNVRLGGEWQVVSSQHIGYLDQNYRNLDDEKTVWQSLAEIRPDWTMGSMRDHLNSFLFRKNEEVMAQIRTLSGGERARLSLCLIASQPVRLLLLDEISNNIDRETRGHVVSALGYYDGAMLVISHDRDLLAELNVTRVVSIRDRCMIESL